MVRVLVIVVLFSFFVLGTSSALADENFDPSSYPTLEADPNDIFDNMPAGAEDPNIKEGSWLPNYSSPLAQTAGSCSVPICILRIANKTIGVHETCGDNCGKQIQHWTGGGRVPWCAFYATWVIRQGGGHIIRNGYVPYLVSYYKSRKHYRWRRRGKIGYLAVFPNRGTSTPGHVGIVVGRRGRSSVTIEGNTSSPYGYDWVARRRHRPSDMLGFIKTY